MRDILEIITGEKSDDNFTYWQNRNLKKIQKFNEELGKSVTEILPIMYNTFNKDCKHGPPKNLILQAIGSKVCDLLIGCYVNFDLEPATDGECPCCQPLIKDETTIVVQNKKVYFNNEDETMLFQPDTTVDELKNILIELIKFNKNKIEEIYA